MTEPDPRHTDNNRPMQRPRGAETERAAPAPPAAGRPSICPHLLAIEPLSVSVPGWARFRPGPTRPDPTAPLQTFSARRLGRPARLRLIRSGPGPIWDPGPPEPAGGPNRQPEGGVSGFAAGRGHGRAEERRRRTACNPSEHQQHRRILAASRVYKKSNATNG